MKNEEIKGYVYILTNPSFREDWVKIGKSCRPVDIRSKELDNTAVPLPFEIYATLETAKYEKVEKLIHKTIDRLTDLRIRQNREFFNVHPAEALEILKDISSTLDDAVIDEVYNRKHGLTRSLAHSDGVNDIERKSTKKSKPNFKFSMIGLKAGDEVLFDPADIVVRVASDAEVEYQGRLWTLSAFTAEFMPEARRFPSNAYQGPKYFSYQGKTLTQLRAEYGV